MSFEYILKSHSDIGYNNFFDVFKDEYMKLYINDKAERHDLIDSYLIKYNARINRITLNGLIFDSEGDFILFALKWS